MVKEHREGKLNLTRRHFLHAGAAAGLLSIAGRPSVTAAASFAPQIDSRLKARALLALAAKRSSIRNADVIGIADFSRPSADPRFYLLDVMSGRVSAHHVSHGRGSDPDHCGWLEAFSNEYNSLATSRGSYVTGDFYTGKYGYSLRLSGLDPTNSNAEGRAIVVHSAWYAEPEIARQQGKLGRSEGCFAFGAASHREMLARLGPGRLLYADKV
ncbi:murein L,D-transpeptidase catalytic domain family protein [Sphingosinicella humi]|uniref:murein L,D-transpeptidase catalytic domain family protein n=1 Tax=Allosphingosinicella humi TaxID=2068657 RepID=UPI001FB186E2|nr:murein L,D-transpeptidase catalytic domain family protein [Sphingosinicella humi]